MKKYLKNDFKQISHATRVARHAERIGRIEGGNPALILCSSYLHTIGSNEALRKYNVTTMDYVKQESAAIARSFSEGSEPTKHSRNVSAPLLPRRRILQEA